MEALKKNIRRFGTANYTQGVMMMASVDCLFEAEALPHYIMAAVWFVGFCVAYSYELKFSRKIEQAIE